MQNHSRFTGPVACTITWHRQAQCHAYATCSLISQTLHVVSVTCLWSRRSYAVYNMHVLSLSKQCLCLLRPCVMHMSYDLLGLGAMSCTCFMIFCSWYALCHAYVFWPDAVWTSCVMYMLHAFIVLTHGIVRPCVMCMLHAFFPCSISLLGPVLCIFVTCFLLSWPMSL